jgi:hypothetical protein
MQVESSGLMGGDLVGLEVDGLGGRTRSLKALDE